MTFIDIRGRRVNQSEPQEFKPLMSQQAIADRFGVSKSRIYQIEKKALRKFVAGCERRAKRAGVSLVEWLLCEGA